MTHTISPRGQIIATQRFWARTAVPVAANPDRCWLYKGPLNRDGYGVITAAGTKMYAHVFAYELIVGPVPEGKQLDHVRSRGCTHHNCVNPEHLEPVTSKENTLRGDSPPAKNAQKSHCVHGHPLSGDNLYITPQGYRECRTCRAARCAPRGRAKLSEVCPQGHTFTPENTGYKPNGVRRCMTCNREKARERRARQRTGTKTIAPAANEDAAKIA